MSQLSTGDSFKLFASPREIGVRLGSGRWSQESPRRWSKPPLRAFRPY